MTISNFSVTPSIVAPGESMHVEFTIKVTASDDVNGLHIYGGNASGYMVYMDDDWTLAAGKTKTVSIDKALPKELKYISQNIGDNRTLVDPKWAVVLGGYGSRYEIDDPVTYLNMRYLPTIAEFSMERASNGIANDEGENLLTSLRLSIADGADASDMRLKLYYAQDSVPTTASACIDLSDHIPALLSGAANSASLIPDSFSNGSDWNFMLVFGDDYETTAARFSISRSFANVHMSGCKTGGICFGGFSSAAEGEPKLESYYPIYPYGGIEKCSGVVKEISLEPESKFALYGESSPLCLRTYGNIVQLIGEVTPTAAISGSTTEYAITEIPAEYAPKHIISRICQGSGTNLWMVRVYPADSASRPYKVTFGRYRNSSSYSTASAGSWLPFEAMWIADDAAQEES